MLARVLREIPKLTDAVARAELQSDESYGPSMTGATDATPADEPWPGYDEQTVAEIQSAVDTADRELADRVRVYERAHKDRSGVLTAVDREPSAS